MKRIYPLLALLLLCGQTIYATPVDESTARTVGYNFLKGMGTVGAPADLTLSYTATANVNGTAVNDFYVFNAGTSGFVIVSANDIVIPVLAYSNTSSFDISHISPDTKSWIEGYKNQITYQIQNSQPALQGTSEKWAALKKGTAKSAEKTTSVSPMVTTTWDQMPYYNVDCPYDYAAGDQTVTGCVATAMAQLMRYWRWPTVGCGKHTYTDGSYGTLTANFCNTAYKWSSMPNNVTDTNVAVATLMYHAGVSVDMSYGTAAAGGSGSWVISNESYGINCAEHALKTYFHYKPSLQGIARFGAWGGSSPAIDETTWINMLETELTAHHPLIYSGSGSDGGHCWVCDGFKSYEGTEYFHFNWGWSGLSNGYFTVDNLAPSALGTGGGAGNFNSDQTAIFGIVPDSFPNTPGNIQLAAHLNTSASPVEYNHPFSITTQIKNTDSTTAFSGDFCAQVFDTTCALVGTIQTYTSEALAAGASSGNITFSSAGITAMVAGTYSIRVMYRNSGDEAWTPVANNDTNINYTVVDVYNDTDIMLFSDINISTGTPLWQGNTVTVQVNVGNTGSAAFNGSVRAMLYSLTDTGAYEIQTLTGKYISASYSGVALTFNTSDLTAPLGTYALIIEHQYNGTGSFYTTGSDYAANPILVSVVNSTTGVQVVAGNSDVIAVYPNPASEIAYVDMKGTEATEIRITDMHGREVKKIPTTGNTTATVAVNDLSAGIYFIQVKTNSGTIIKKLIVTR